MLNYIIKNEIFCFSCMDIMWGLIIIDLLLFLLLLLIVRKRHFFKRIARDLAGEYKFQYHKNALPDFEKKYLDIIKPRVIFDTTLNKTKLVQIYNEITGRYNNYNFKFFTVKREFIFEDVKNKIFKTNVWDNVILMDFPNLKNSGIEFIIRRKGVIPSGWKKALFKYFSASFPNEVIQNVNFSTDDFVYALLNKPEQNKLQLFTQKKVQDFIYDLVKIPLERPKKKDKIIYEIFVLDNVIGINLNCSKMQKHFKNYPLTHYLEYLSSIIRELIK